MYLDLDEALDVEADFVPGDPPVPGNVWRAPGPAGQLSVRLLARIVIGYTARGQVVFNATAQPVLAQVVAALGRTVARGDEEGSAALAVCGWPPGRPGLDTVIALRVLRRRLAPDGVLVVVAATGDEEPFDSGPVVAAAAAARLSYLQHLVAVHAPVVGDRLDVPAEPAAPASRGDGGVRHRKVHTDVLAFAVAAGRDGGDA